MIDDQDEAASLYVMLKRIDLEGAKYLQSGEVFTKHLRGKLFEMKICKHRIYYVYLIENKVILLHACYKQKGKAEKNDMEIGLQRMKEVQKRLENS